MGVVEILNPHNLEAYQEINKLLESGIKKIAIPRATGSGKTYIVGALAEKYNSDKKLVLEPTRPLLDSIKEKFNEFGITNTDFITYQKLIRMSDKDIAAMDYKVIFLDECHHGTAPIWGQKIDYLMKTHSESVVFGTSATTVRNDGVNVVETLFDNNAIEELSLSTAIARKVLPCPHYITAIYRLDDEFEKLKKRIEGSTNSKADKKEFYKKMQEMKLHFEKSYGVPLILNKYVKVRNGRYLVFCRDKKHLDSMRDVVVDWFQTAGIKDIHSYAVYSDYPDKEKDYQDFCEDNSDSLKLLFSINMLNEGLHIEGISGVLMLRTTRSNLIYLQQLGRLLEAGNMDKYLLVFDFVNNFSSVNDGVGLLKEIKDAVAKEKENDPDFDDSEFEGIDTFFVLEQVVEIQEMFKEIEEKLQDDWDAMFNEYCKFYEENGHGDVPKTDEYRKLNNWCKYQRDKFNRGILDKDKKRLLEQKNFVWNTLKFRFENNIKAVAKYYFQYGEYPYEGSENLEERKLGTFFSNEKFYIRKKGYVYPEWKIELINKYLPEFSSKKEIDKAFDKFIYYVKTYKEKNGHINIKSNDVIDGYNIGCKYFNLRKSYRENKLNKDKIDKLQKIGFLFENKLDKQFNDTIRLAEKAVAESILISRSNQMYKGINLYVWMFQTVKHKFYNKILSNEQIDILEKLIGKTLYELFNHGNFVKVVDVIENREIGIYKSCKQTIDYIKKFFDGDITRTVVDNRLYGKVTTPYKERFMFYYATDEEVKKYMEEKK